MGTAVCVFEISVLVLFVTFILLAYVTVAAVILFTSVTVGSGVLVTSVTVIGVIFVWCMIETVCDCPHIFRN